MKRYIKNNITQLANRIVIIKDGIQYINPSEEMILADGWEEYREPEATEVSTERLLEIEKISKTNEIELYDLSPNVNTFYYDGIMMWLDKATRAGLLLRFQAEKAQGLISTALWYNGVQFQLSVDNAIAMLYAIELYASACYDNTQRHLAAVNALTTIEEVEQYDYQGGYPDKLRF